MTAGSDPHPEFSRLIPLQRLGAQRGTRDIVASTQERAALACRFQVLSLDRLEARLSFGRKGSQLILVEGALTAVVTQCCVVSLLPVKNRLHGKFRQVFTNATDASVVGDVLVELEEEEPAEALGSQGLDLGEVVAQQLALLLDPYPRADDAELAPMREKLMSQQELEPQPQGNAVFSVLRDLKVGK